MDANLEKWVDKWAEAQEKGIFQDNTPEPTTTDIQDYFGNWKTEVKKSVNLNECDAKYWKQVYKLSINQRDVAEQTSAIKDDPIGSEPQGKLRDVPDKESLATKAGELANTANPVIPSTRGEDQRKHVTPDWSDGKGLRELVDMKHSLYTLEGKLNSHPKFGAYGSDSPEIKKI